jgi:hypothetical protein
MKLGFKLILKLIFTFTSSKAIKSAFLNEVPFPTIQGKDYLYSAIFRAANSNH